MASPVILPQQGDTVESCNIISWHKAVGDQIAYRDILINHQAVDGVPAARFLRALSQRIAEMKFFLDL